MGLTRFVSAVLLIFALSTLCRADVAVSVDHGWDGIFRSGHWTPVFITVTSDKPRPVLIELYAPHDRSFGMAPHLLATASPRPSTYPMIVPMNFGVRDAVVTVRDPQTMRKLADAPLVPDNSPSKLSFDFEKTITGDLLLIGVGGSQPIPALKNVRAANHDAAVGLLDIDDLPTTAIGYDGLDVLVLPNPSFAKLSLDQQSAIVDWVRAGGRLIILPGESTVPAGSLLESILPASLGEARSLDLSSSQLNSLGLSNRFAHLLARQLTPTPDATEFKLLSNPAASAYIQRVGFGRTVLLPFNAAQLPLLPDPAKSFWQPIIESICELSTAPNAPNSGDASRADIRRSQAINPLIEFLGNVPGIGRFDFSYIAYALIGLMLLVGPIDWFVLKRIGRQPWTWLTTTGWVVLLTLIAITLGQSLKSGDLYFRSIEISDEADHASIARTALAGLYSPSTDNYTITADPETWWQPLAPINDNYYYNSRGAHNDISFTQTYRGNLPDPMRVNIWSLRFLQSESIGQTPARITASLTFKNNLCSGAITNSGDTPLSRIVVRIANSNFDLAGTLAPGETRTLNDQPLKNTGIALPQSDTPQRRPYVPYETPVPSLENLTTIASNLAGQRSLEIDHLLSTSRFACIYALAESAPTSIHLSPAPKFEQHYLVIRSLIPLSKP